tara:strand:- start:1848 stop:3098 length:1251 start_codon:yes stop_codon:yes gene_type:complete
MKKTYLQKELKKLKVPKNKFFYPLNHDNLRNKDLSEGIKVIFSRQLTMSNMTRKFEDTFKKKLNLKYSLMVNSGSSANLLALQCLINPYREKRLKSGDEVLVPAICWSTSLWPIIQSGLKPVFVDVDRDTFNISLKDLKSKINKKTKALMLVHVLGNSVNMEKLNTIIKKNKIILIEDTCESLGSRFKKKYLGGFGDFSTFSFYYSHQITSGEGGMICCKSEKDYEILKTLRSHGYSRVLKNRLIFEKKYNKIDNRFLFVNSGFNFRPTDIQAAIGLSQFKSLDNFARQRSINRKKIINILTNDKLWNNQVKFLEENKNVKASWFGLPLLVNNIYKNKKFKIIKKLVQLGIDNRPIISGNFARQPAIKKYNILKKGMSFPNADYINNLGFFIGLPAQKISYKTLKMFKNAFFKSFN